jgi:hypothetical protein
VRIRSNLTVLAAEDEIGEITGSSVSQTRWSL